MDNTTEQRARTHRWAKHTLSSRFFSRRPRRARRRRKPSRSLSFAPFAPLNSLQSIGHGMRDIERARRNTHYMRRDYPILVLSPSHVIVPLSRSLMFWFVPCRKYTLGIYDAQALAMKI